MSGTERLIDRLADRLADEQTKVRTALAIAREFGQTDGAHHKTWVIDQMVRALAGDRYAEWTAGYDWDTGVAP